MNDIAALTEAPPSDSPDWSAITEEIHCPLCNYNLRGLVEPRCPECGYRCEWPDLLDPSRRLHPYLFEHHPESDLRTFLRTGIGALLPRRFWKSLRPVQPSNVRRLVVYWVYGVVLSGLIFGMVVALSAWKTAADNSAAQAITARFVNSPAGAATRKWAIQNYGTVNAYLESEFPSTFHTVFGGLLTGVLREFLPWFVIVMVWPWCVYMSSQVFGITLKHVRLKESHLMRCSFYTYDVPTWFVPMMLVPFLGSSAVTLRLFVPTTIGLPIVIIFLFLLVLVGGFYRYVTALSCYLRFPNPLFTSTITYIIAGLLALNVFLAATVW